MRFCHLFLQFIGNSMSCAWSSIETLSTTNRQEILNTKHTFHTMSVSFHMSCDWQRWEMAKLLPCGAKFITAFPWRIRSDLKFRLTFRSFVVSKRKQIYILCSGVDVIVSILLPVFFFGACDQYIYIIWLTNSKRALIFYRFPAFFDVRCISAWFLSILLLLYLAVFIYFKIFNFIILLKC